MVRRIGGYEITGKIGDGGFGSVYKAYDPSMERVVAIKVLSVPGDPSLISRFGLEAKTAGSLHHKNIVTIYKFDKDEGVPFLAMEYLDGVDLQQIITDKSNRESITLLEKLEIMAEVAQGLQCAHENGIVHRDVKPANIMRLKDGSVKIMDFGIARLTTAAATRLTQTGLMIGTVYYMAPEQFTSGEADKLCDVWAYGVVFYELLTGVHPFRANDPARVMYRITTEDPPPLSSLLPGCSPELDAGIQQLLSKDPRQRFQSLDDFLLDLEAIIRALAKIEIPDLLSRAARLIDSDQTDLAQSVVNRILKLDRSNLEARHLRERLRERTRLQAIRPKVEALIRQADEHVVSRNFAAALEKLDSALNLDPRSPTLASRISRIRNEEQRARQADELISRGRRALSEGDLTDAFTRFSEALEIDPGHSHATSLLDEVKRAMGDREVRSHIESAMEQANALIFVQEYDDAIALLSELEASTRSDEQVSRRLAEARQLKQTQEARERLNAGINAARDLLKSGKYHEACGALQELDRENPNNPAIEVLVAHARERLQAGTIAQQVETLINQARGQRAAGRRDAALECIARALELDRRSGKALALQRAYLDEAQLEQDTKNIEAGLRQAGELFEQNKLDEASVLLERLGADYPTNSRIVQAKIDVAGRIKKRDELLRLQAQKGLEEAERLLAQGRAESATSLLGELTTRFPADAAIRDLIIRARRLRDSQEAEAGERADRIRELLALAERERRNQRFDRALKLVDQALKLDSTGKETVALQRALVTEKESEGIRQHIDREIKKIVGLLNDDKVDTASDVVRRLEREFPENALIREAKRSLAEKISALEHSRERLIQEKVDEAEHLLSSGDAKTAAKLLKVAIAQHPGTARLAVLLERAQRVEREQTAAEQVRKNLVAARKAAENHEWDKAYAILEVARKSQPSCQEYIEEAEKFERWEDLDRRVVAAKAAMESGEFDQAISIAEAAMSKFPEEPRPVAVLQDARSRRELRDLIVYARRRIANGDLNEARQLLADCRARFPQSAEWQEVESEIDRLKGLEQCLQIARTALRSGSYDEARRALTAVLKEHPESSVAGELLAETKAQQQEHELRQAYDQGRATAEQLLRALQFSRAVEKLEDLLISFPRDSALEADLERACAARDSHNRQYAHTKGRKEVQELFDAGKFDEAIATVEVLLGEFTGDLALTSDLESVRKAKFLREERVRLDALVSELEASFRKGDAEAVRQSARDLLKKHKEPRALELLAWAETAIAKSKEIRRTGRTLTPRLILGGIGLALAGGALLFSLSRGSDISVEPSEIVFSYRRGDPVPPAQPVHIAGSARLHWTASSQNVWFLVSGKQGVGIGDISASIQPSGLSAGDYTGIATISAASLQKTLHVRLRVTDSVAQTPKTDERRTGESKEAQEARKAAVQKAPDDRAKKTDTPSSPEIKDPVPKWPPQGDCSEDTYGGIRHGEITWSGYELKPGEELYITQNRPSKGQFGRHPDPMPGCPVIITVPPSVDFNGPSPATNYWQLRLTNKSDQPINGLLIKWRLIEPAAR